MSFKSFGLHPSLERAVEDLGFTEPTPIQEKAIPPALEGRDVLACAMTGSGKTAAFLLPILHRLIDLPRGTTRVLVLSPTRELAAQTAEHFAELAKHTSLRGAAVYGGVGMAPQEEAFRKGFDVLVATPGRLLDHFQYPYAKLDGLDYLVLDEADRMLDMGFLPDVRRVLRHLAQGEPRRRQTMMLSATMPPPIVELSRELLDEPVAIDVERASAPAHGVEQTVFPVAEELKRPLLLELLRRDAIHSAIIFTRTKHRANRLADWLVKQGIDCHRIHGNRSQKQRTEALADFKEGKTRILVATDIAARGIDVEALSHVVNFDVPHVPDDYIHRVGRTARASATGDALTLVSPGEIGLLRQIERALGRSLDQRVLEDFDYHAAPQDKLEVPLNERIAQIRARKQDERARAKAKAERKAAPQGSAPAAGQGEAQPPNTAGGTARFDQPGPGNGKSRRRRRSRGRGAGRPQDGPRHPAIIPGPLADDRQPSFDNQPHFAAPTVEDPEVQPVDPTRERLFGPNAYAVPGQRSRGRGQGGGGNGYGNRGGSPQGGRSGGGRPQGQSRRGPFRRGDR